MALLFEGLSKTAPIVSVLLPVNLDKLFNYIIPPDITQPSLGSYVLVPFRNREICGIVWQHPKESTKDIKLKPIIETLAVPPISVEMRYFIEKVAQYNCASKGNVLKLVLSAKQGFISPPITKFLRVKLKADLSILTTRRLNIYKRLEQEPATKKELISEGYSYSIIKALLSQNYIEECLATTPKSAQFHANHAQNTLTNEQDDVSSAINTAMADTFQTILLDGATGSGKTEVYFEAVETTINLQKQVLILLPEIALTLQVINRAQKRFGITPILWHSSMTPSARKKAIYNIIHGNAPLIIGARSALFLPYQKLGLIIVDEEHDSSFKQDDGVIYHARDMAVLRAHTQSIPIILASATPSLETLTNAHDGKYLHLTLGRRHMQASLPEVTLIDMRAQKQKPGTWISKPLKAAIEATLEQGQQTLLFLNRRGYAPLMLCRSCGHRYACSNCSSWLVYHKVHKQLVCHHCGLLKPPPKNCSSCDSEDSLVLCGPGVERVAEETALLFPEARISIIAGDDSATELKNALAAVTAGEVDIVIGTQLLAKGHHFPSLALVGIIDGDAGLQGSDVRTSEKTYQLLHQLSGRAGREQSRGSVYIQTFKPEHPMMSAVATWNRDSFTSLELEQRQLTNMPPFGRLAALIIEGKPENKVISLAKDYAATCPSLEEVLILGPAPAPMYKIRNLYRYRFLVRAPKHIDIQKIMITWRDSQTYSSTITVKIDIDPINFM